MRYIFIALLFIFPSAVSAQTKADCEHIMARFMKFYNARQNDSIYEMFSVEDRKYISSGQNAEAMKWNIDSMGFMKSYEYLGIDSDDPEHVFVFKTNWSRIGEKTSSFTLDKEYKFNTFRLWTSSPGIDKLLKKKK